MLKNLKFNIRNNLVSCDSPSDGLEDETILVNSDKVSIIDLDWNNFSENPDVVDTIPDIVLG